MWLPLQSGHQTVHEVGLGVNTEEVCLYAARVATLVTCINFCYTHNLLLHTQLVAFVKCFSSTTQYKVRQCQPHTHTHTHASPTNGALSQCTSVQNPLYPIPVAGSAARICLTRTPACSRGQALLVTGAAVSCCGSVLHPSCQFGQLLLQLLLVSSKALNALQQQQQ